MTDYEQFTGYNYQIDVINEAKDTLRSALEDRDILQAKQFGLGSVEKDPLDHEAYDQARTEVQARINVHAMNLVDMMDVYTRNWK